MTLQDTVQLATTTTDGYGDKTVTVLTESKALFIQRSGLAHTLNADGVVGDATVYLDPTNSIVTDNAYRLEGMYIVVDDEWYRVVGVSVGQRKLLDNAIDNIFCTLRKEAGVPYVSYIS